jgi:hypothetical protein
MAISEASLIIGYSVPEYNPVFVKCIFDTIFGEGFVEYVIEKVFTSSGRPAFKKFYLFIHDQDHPALKQIKDIIAKKKFAKIGYKNEWDRSTRKYVDRYWKVYDTPNRPEFKPYLITETPIEPWSAEADAAFRWQQIGKDCRCSSCLLHPTTYDEDLEAAMPRITYKSEDAEAEAAIAECRIPTMERDNGEPKNEEPKNGGPYNMVRAVNMAATQTEAVDYQEHDDSYWDEYWKLKGPPKLVRQTNEMPPTEDEYDTAKDFADLEAAVAEYGEDYPGSIAPKIPKPPKLTRTETEDWDGLAKSLDEFMGKLPQEEWFDRVSGN